MAKISITVGQVFGKLTVVSRVDNFFSVSGHARWVCQCECGNQTNAYSHNLKQGRARSCGCDHRSGRRAEKHGMSHTTEYHSWASMIARCYKKNTKSYKDYGARGITVCERWRISFSAFIADMGPRPSPQHEIDRKENNGPYCPENCHWTTHSIQARNRRSNHRVTYQGETLCIAEWAEKTGISQYVLILRIARYGWTPHRALTTPVRNWGPGKKRA